MTTETSGYCVNCSSPFRSSKRNSGGQKGEDGLSEIGVKVEVPFVDAGSDNDDDDLDILSWEMITQRIKVEEAIGAIYKLQFLNNSTKFSSSSTTSKNNNKNPMKICEKCADVLKNLYQYYLKFGQLREATSDLAKSIDVVDTVLELQKKICLKLQTRCDIYQDVDDKEEEHDDDDRDDDNNRDDDNDRDDDNNRDDDNDRDNDDDDGDDRADDDNEIKDADNNENNAYVSDKCSFDNFARVPVNSCSSPSKVILSSSSLMRSFSKLYPPPPPSPPHAKSVPILLRTKRPHSPVHQSVKEVTDPVVANKNNLEKRMRSTSGPTSSISNTHGIKNIDSEMTEVNNVPGEIENELICGDIDDDEIDELDSEVSGNPLSSPIPTNATIMDDEDRIETEMVTVKIDPTDILLGINQNNFDPLTLKSVGSTTVAAEGNSGQPSQTSSIQTHQNSTERQPLNRKQTFSTPSHTEINSSEEILPRKPAPRTVLKCPFCEKRFSLRKDLTFHSLVDHGRLIYFCPVDYCDSFFIKFNTVEEHQRQCHNMSNE